MRRKEERSKQGQTNNKTKQHSTPKVVTFPKKNELQVVGSAETGSPSRGTHASLREASTASLMRDEKEGRKKKTRSNKQHSTPKAVTFPKKNELPQVGLEPTTLYTPDRALYH